MKKIKSWQTITKIGKIKKKCLDIVRLNNLSKNIREIDSLDNFFNSKKNLVYKNLIFQEIL